MTAADRSEDAAYWYGFDERECGEHRTTGGRAWCFDCGEWCYDTVPCKGCELPQVRALLRQAHDSFVELVSLCDRPPGTSELLPHVRRISLRERDALRAADPEHFGRQFEGGER